MSNLSHVLIYLTKTLQIAENISSIYRIFAENNAYIYRRKFINRGKIHLST